MLLALVILLFAAGAAYGALILVTRVDSILFPGTQIHLPFTAPGSDEGNDSSAIGNRPFNVLVMGLDRRPNEGDTLTRTDTMMVVTINPVAKTAGILGIPRDMYVEIPNEDGGYFEERVNTALEYGVLYDYPGGGPQLAEDTIERNLNIKIDHYVIIDFPGFKEVIDSLGGIDVDVPDYLDDPYYSESEKPGDYFPLHFEPGMQHMDGSTALGYARSRNTTSDLDRIQRQQRVIFAVMDKALGLDVLKNAGDLWKQYQHTVATDINDFEIVGFAKLAADISPSRISALSLGSCTAGAMIRGMSVQVMSKEGCQRIVDALFSDQQLLADKAVVEVREGTDGNMTEIAVQLLTDLGFPDSSVIASDPTEDFFAQTQIVDFADKTYSAGKIAEWLGVPLTAARAATPEDASLRVTGADIVVILGADADLLGLSSDADGGDSSQ
jgi:LCP family protein required for cell wall assembly